MPVAGATTGDSARPAIGSSEPVIRTDRQAADAFGPSPNEEAVAEAQVWNHTTQQRQMSELVSVSLSQDEAARILGVSSRTVSRMLARGSLVGLKVGRSWRLPVWQFDRLAPGGLVPGLPDIVALFPASLLALSRWIAIENADLGGLTPRAAIQAGRLAEVLGLIRAL